METIFKQIVKLKNELSQTLHFNLKIEANRKFHNFLKENGITVRCSEPFCFFYKDEKEICVIGNRYAKRKINGCYRVLGGYLEIRETGQQIKF